MVPMEAIDWDTYKFIAKKQGIPIAKAIGIILDEYADTARKKMDPNIQARLNDGGTKPPFPQQGKPQGGNGNGNRPPIIYGDE